MTDVKNVNEKGLGYFAANSLTVARAGLVLGAGIALLTEDWVSFRNLMVAGAVTDVLDGRVAKYTNSISPEGAARERFVDIAYVGLLVSSLAKVWVEAIPNAAIPVAAAVVLFFIGSSMRAWHKTNWQEVNKSLNGI